MADDEISRDIESFRSNASHYQSVKDEVGKLSGILGERGIGHIWESRVKTPESLEKKLRNRKRDGKSGISGIADLVGGRVVLLRLKDSETVTTLIKERFELDEDPIQHPTSKEHRERLGQRFRGYDGLHFRFRLKDVAKTDVVVELQVVHIIMWMYYQVEHDLGYKGGQNSRELEMVLEMLKGPANLNTSAFEQFEEVIGNQQSKGGRIQVTRALAQCTKSSMTSPTVSSQIQILLDPENQELFGRLLKSHTSTAAQGWSNWKLVLPFTYTKFCQVDKISSIVPKLHDSLQSRCMNLSFETPNISWDNVLTQSRE